MKQSEIRKGIKVGSLTAIRPWGHSRDGHIRWLFKCDCGNYKPIIVNNAGKNTNSCTKCGFHVDDWNDFRSSSKYNKLYLLWGSMRNRCDNPNRDSYHSYGGRGIKVCDEWSKSYSIFKKWAIENGYDYRLGIKDQSLDRIDVNGNYEPDNCRWVDMKTQNYNKRNNIHIIFNGEETNLFKLSEYYQINYNTLRSRYRNGWRGEKLVSQPKRQKPHS